MKNPTIGLTAIIFSCIVCFAVVFFLVPPVEPVDPNDSNNTSSVSTSSASSSVNTSLIVDRDFDFAGIKDNGVIALFGESQQEFAAELDDKNWSSIQWSPDGKYISVLGEKTEGASLDIFLYEISTAKWEVITPYADTAQGVSGYLWEDATKILFTQGPRTDNWVHRYDLEQEELRKLFEVTGKLIDLKDGEIIVVESISGDKLINIYDVAEGALKYIFDQQQTDALDSLQTARFASEADAFLVRGQKNAENTTIWANLILGGESPEYNFAPLPQNAIPTDSEDKDLVTLCAVGSEYYVYDRANKESISIFRLDPGANSMEAAYSSFASSGLNLAPGSFSCYQDGLLARLQTGVGSSRAAWLNITSQGGSELAEANDYVELVGM